VLSVKVLVCCSSPYVMQFNSFGDVTYHTMGEMGRQLPIPWIACTYLALNTIECGAVIKYHDAHDMAVFQVGECEVETLVLHLIFMLVKYRILLFAVGQYL